MKQYYIKTFGCQMNESDSQRIASFLENQGYTPAKDMIKADLIVVNACSVRQTAIDRIFGLKKTFKKLKAKKVLVGCIIKSDIKNFSEFFDQIIDIKKLLGGNYFSIIPKSQSPTTAYLPIMTGCDNFCSYCVVPYTRGREISRKINDITKEFKVLIKQGNKEIILLGQNVNSYEYGFSKLLTKLNNLTGDFKIKFLTNHPKDMSDELINTIAKCEKIIKEIHLPVQSGDNEILKKMNRKYTIEQYCKLIEKIRHKIPDVKITTDVIVGFPGEKEKQFQNTVKLFKKINYHLAFVNKYSPRVGTIAYKLGDNVPWKEKKRRWEILNKIANQKVSTPVGKKLIVISGPTASGKSDLAVKIALRLGSEQAEIVSADSRQIYKGMNIGTGKITRKKMKGIPHYMIDIVSPRKQISVAEYRKLTLQAIDKIYKKGKTPILCGGTGFYIRAVADGIIIPEVKPDWKLRKELENKTEEELFKQLKKLDPNRAKNIDVNNRRRLIRAIEIVLKTGKPIPQFSTNSQYDTLYLGIKKSLPELKQRINQRVDKMIKAGLEKEVKNLFKKHGKTTVLKNTIGYKEWQKEDPINAIKLHTYQYAKKQLTWFAKYPGKKINWVSTPAQAEKLVKEFLS